MARSWLPGVDESAYSLNALPYGVVRLAGRGATLVVRAGDHLLDLGPAAAAGLLPHRALLDAVALNPLMAAGRSVWQEVRAGIIDLLGDHHKRERVEPFLQPLARATPLLAWQVGDYADFYSSLDHATNLGRILRPGSEPLPPNWRHLPAGYHGRAGTVVVSGTPVTRPCGLTLAADEAAPTYRPSQRLDIEAEVGFVVGVPSALGTPVGVDAADKHVFGVVLVNDWSARDIQAYEYQPLGPFLGKSFATSVSAWLLPLEALGSARGLPPPQEPEPAAYLRAKAPWSLDLDLIVDLNGTVVSRPPFAGMYWTIAQQLAHLTANGAAVRTGDLLASGTVSGPTADQRGSLIELSWNGRDPLALADGETRTFLADGDTVTISATGPDPHGGRIALGDVTGTVLPAVAARDRAAGG